MLNRVELIGYVGKDPELRKTAQGISVCNMSLCTSETYRKKDGTKQKADTWHSLVSWTQMAETISKYVHKGSLLYVCGRIDYGKYTDRDGNERFKTDIRVDNIKFLDKNPNNREQDQGYNETGGNW